MGASRNRRKVILVTEVAVRLGLVLAFWELERQEPFTRMIQPEEAWLYRNPMTESYVPGSLLWKMVFLVPVMAILGSFAVSTKRLKSENRTKGSISFYFEKGKTWPFGIITQCPFLFWFLKTLFRCSLPSKTNPFQEL